MVVGTGPAEEELRRSLPEATYLGWTAHERLPEIYSACDLLLMPSRFDTFGNVVLEAMSCGCPAVAYKTKGPKDIIEHGRNGYVVNNCQEFSSRAADYLTDPERQRKFRRSAQYRARRKHDVDVILEQFLTDIGLAPPDSKIRHAA